MNGKKGSFKINIPVSATKAKLQQPKTGKKDGGIDDQGFSCNSWIKSVWKFAKEDTKRVTFSFKVGLAVLLASLLILFKAPYDIFGTKIIWSILSVVLMFEYTVGATLNRGFNRGLGSLLAGISASTVGQLALYSSRIAEPIIIGISIFIIGAITSFMKLWPSLEQYEYSFRIILLTYNLIIVSEYRMGDPIRTSLDRMYFIIIGGFIAVLVNVLVFPIWAGEQLHKELVDAFYSVADFLEECVKKYLEDDGLDHPDEFSKNAMDDFSDELAYKRCKSTLDSSENFESLANLAKWEPPHGRFKRFSYPWSEYVKVGEVLRYCGYEVMALHDVLHSEIQAPHDLRIKFQIEIQDATNQAVELIRNLARDICNLNRSPKTILLKRLHTSTKKLQRTMDLYPYLLITYVEPHNPSKSFPKLYDVHSTELDSNNINTNNSNQISQVSILRNLTQPRRMYSWPIRKVNAFKEDGGETVDFVPQMTTLGSTATLSLATFTSLLVAFVEKLDHLVEVVDQLSKMAEFKCETI